MHRVALPAAGTRPYLPVPDAALRCAFMEAMSRSATPVWLVTTAGPAGLHGLTVSAVSAVSAEPPMLLACVNRRSPVAEAVCRNRLLAVSLLAESQAELADVFAGRHPTRTREDGLHADLWETGPSGAPLLRHAVAALDCRLEAAHDAGTHRILVGAVLQAGFGLAEPLLHHRRRYTAPGAALAAGPAELTSPAGRFRAPSPSALPVFLLPAVSGRGKGSAGTGRRRRGETLLTASRPTSRTGLPWSAKDG